MTTSETAIEAAIETAIETAAKAEAVTGTQSDIDAPLPALDQVCRGVAELLRALDLPLRRLTVRVGGTLVEIEWPPPAVSVPPGAPSLSAPVGLAGPPAEQAAASPAGQPAEQPVAQSAGQPAEPSAHLVTAPHVGTFYHRPEPDAEPFVVAGDLVRCGQQIGILEAMKLMNPVEADRDGRVREVLVDDGTPVEFDQPLVSLVVDGAQGAEV